MDKYIYNDLTRFLLLFVICLSTKPLYAERVNVETAQTVAENLAAQMQDNKTGLRSSSNISLVYTAQAATQGGLRSSTDEADFYAFNIGKEQGFVIVSGEDRVYPVIGYSSKGEFNADNMPDNLNAWLEHYQEEINYAITNNLPTSENIQKEWQNYMSGTTKAGSITPVVLLETALWGQNTPYNDMCPISDSGKKTAAGCVATAQAIVMRYHKYPAKAINGVSSYYDIPINYDNYDWNNMPTSYDKNYTESQANAVAKLMFHCGANIEMSYGVGESGASTSKLAQSLIENFNYSKQTRRIYQDNYTWAEWKGMIRKELDSNRPVIYSGSRNCSNPIFGCKGHSFVCDGYTAEGAYHMNWGWEGYCNGYFLLSVLDPEGNGIKYNYHQEIIIGIQPDQGLDYTQSLRMYLFTSEATSIKKGEQFTLVVGFINDGSDKITGWFTTALVDANNNIKEIYTVPPVVSESGYHDLNLSPGEYRSASYFYCIPTKDIDPKDKAVIIYSTDKVNWNIISNATPGTSTEMSVTTGVIPNDEPNDPNEPEAPLNINMLVNGFDDRYISKEGNSTSFLSFTSSDLSTPVCFRYTLKDPSWRSKIKMSYGNSPEAINTQFNFDSNGVAWMDANGHKIEDDLIVNCIKIEPSTSGIMEYEIAVYDPSKTTQYSKFDCSVQIVNPVKIAISEIKGSKDTDIPFTVTVTNAGDFSGKQIRLTLGSYSFTDKSQSIKYINGNTQENIVLTKASPNDTYVGGEHIISSLAETTYNYTFRSVDPLPQASLNISLIDASNNQYIPDGMGTGITISDASSTPCSITYQLDNLSASPKPATVLKEESLIFTLVTTDTYKLPTAINISMSGKTLTAGTDYIYDTLTGKVTITSVTGDISITAKGVKKADDDEYFTTDLLKYKVTGNSTVSIDGVTDDTKTEYTIPSTVTHNNKTYSVTTIGFEAFQRCENLTRFVAPSSLDTIKGQAFSECPNLKEVLLQEGLRIIESEAFCECTSLVNIDLPASVILIEEATFDSCSKLAKITVKAGSEYYKSVDGVLYDKKMSTLHTYPNKHASTFLIPEEVTQIGDYAFCNCTNLTSVTIHNKVKNMGRGAFEGCSGLKEISLPEGLETTGEGVFDSCTGLKSMSLPTSLKTIGYGMFDNCHETLEELHVKYATPLQLGENPAYTFFGYYGPESEICKLYVPKGSKAAYEKAAGWKEFKHIFEEGETTDDSDKPLTPPSPHADITLSSDSSYTDANGNQGKFNGTIGTGTTETEINTLTINNPTSATIKLNRVVIGDGNTTKTAVSVSQNTIVTLQLQRENSLGKVINNGNMTLTGDPSANLIRTAIVNNGIFTDETTFVTQVEGAAALNISAPEDKEITEGKPVTLSASTRVSINYSLTFIWEQLQPDGSWKQIESHNTGRSTLRASETEIEDKLTITPDKTCQYRCRIKNQVEDISTTLITQSATVTVNPGDVGNVSIETGRTVYVRNGILHIRLATPDQVQIIHLNGTILRSLDLSAGETQITGLSEGVYIIRYRDSKTTKVVI